MRLTKEISPYQFACFRILLGGYLLVHFAFLIPYGPELFSNQGVMSDPKLNFTYGILPNPLEHFDTPLAVTMFLCLMVALSFCMAIGVLRRTSAALLWFGWACLFNRNNLISNP